jgi:hypothetical protein
MAEIEKLPDHHEAVTKYFAKHPLFVMLGGLHLSISMVASQVLQYTLKQIYEMNR